MPKELIYAVEDEGSIRKLIQYNLQSAGYRVIAFDTGESVLEKLNDTIPDLLLLDVMLPGIDGFEVLKQIKLNLKTANLPVIMLTAKSEEFDKVLGLELGADDYIPKPFGIRELIARVKAVLRRSQPVNVLESEMIRQGNISIDLVRREVYKNGLLIEMPLKEFELLKTLMLSKGKVLSREMLLDQIWGFDFYGETRTVDVHIRYLRQKIEDNDSDPTYIETVRGIGYKFNDKKHEN